MKKKKQKIKETKKDVKRKATTSCVTIFYYLKITLFIVVTFWG